MGRQVTGRVLITGARAPAAVEMARLFIEIRAEVHVADSTPLLLAAGVDGVAAGHRLPPARGNPGAYGSAVAVLVQQLGIDLVVPTCEEVFFLAAARDAGQKIPLFAPSLALLRRVHDKFSFVRLARAAGVEMPRTELIASAAELSALSSQSRKLVLKPCFSRFGHETLIGVEAPALSRVNPTPASPWIAQELLHGDEICLYAIALEGRLAAFSAYRPLYRMGRAASYYFDPVALPEGERIAAKIIEAAGFHGQIAFDMILTRDRGLLPIECNPRATSGIHLFADQPEIAKMMLTGMQPKEVLRPAQDVQPAMVASAMWLFGLPGALPGNVAAWRRDLRRGRDVLDLPGNSLNGRAWRVFGSYCLEALRSRRSLRAIATSDIEWNGEALDAGA